MAITRTGIVSPTAPWWVGLILGLTAVFVGLLLVDAPGMTIALIVQVLGLYWLASGIVHIASIFVDSTRWGWKLAGGILGIIAGMATLNHPLWATVLLPATLVIVIAMLGLFFGVTGIIAAFAGSGWGYGIIGAVSVIFGLGLLFNPLGSAVPLAFLFGILAIGGGIAVTIMAFRERGMQKRDQRPATARR